MDNLRGVRISLYVKVVLLSYINVFLYKSVCMKNEITEWNDDEHKYIA